MVQELVVQWASDSDSVLVTRLALAWDALLWVMVRVKESASRLVGLEMELDLEWVAQLASGLD
jgi:hypothetical protein